jgi:predicted TIM-barrel fold metal-dependent hydrolase
MNAVLEDIKVVDADTHVVEPPDLWTSRMASSWGDLVPHVEWNGDRQEEVWVIGDQPISPVASAAMAGWNEYPPDHPRRWSDADPAAWDARQRLARMDQYGIYAQLMYPNVALFGSKSLQNVADAGAQLEYVRAYNDFQTDFAEIAPDRLLPVTSLPFWDLDATIAEMQRCADKGHRGIIFTQDPGYFGQPELTDRYWDRMWAAAQELELPVNFHIASGDTSLLERAGHPDNGPHANYASMGVSFFMGNARTFAQLVCGGICHRFPELNFVSVESGIGWIPFALDCLDWQWKNCGVHLEHPEYDLLPSEYFARQIYGCFWFEKESLPYALERLGPDHILYETDFPHPTSMSPGPATSAVAPDEFIADTFRNIDPASTHKILHDNAARLYHLD